MDFDFQRQIIPNFLLPGQLKRTKKRKYLGFVACHCQEGHWQCGAVTCWVCFVCYRRTCAVRSLRRASRLSKPGLIRLAVPFWKCASSCLTYPSWDKQVLVLLPGKKPGLLNTFWGKWSSCTPSHPPGTGGLVYSDTTWMNTDLAYLNKSVLIF